MAENKEIRKYHFPNGLRLLYTNREGDLTSFCIGFESGALFEKEDEIGLAHVVEHMLFKGTKEKNEAEINTLCDELFGFNNAMTNYPYAIYYGTTLSNDFRKGYGLYNDIVFNPIFPGEGFEEEKKIICEELIEWKDDNEQYCEDELLNNAFKKRRIKELIIGKEEQIRSFSIDKLKDFYCRWYVPENCVISVVSSLPYEDILEIVSEKVSCLSNNFSPWENNLYERNTPGIFEKVRKGIQGAKIQYCFPIDSLSEEEIKALYLFNLSFGEGTSCILYEDIRTKHGLVYDISSRLKNEKGIKLFIISAGTSPENTDKVIELINKNINNIKTTTGYFDKHTLEMNSKRFKRKRELGFERSIELCKGLTTYELMYGNYEILFSETLKLNNITSEFIHKTINKVLKEPTIQIVIP